ncbi:MULTISPECIES: dihydroneopterin aldolase [Devosia]|jgi:dihydroneopterin aldolase|uniref:7,8-dihydroneopterin aldolase n=1 Tax=Devosia litorisediminis TaxID=2829817 RepID=A0A942EB84_9HYPH|nr:MULTISPECIES: dihydroneopterin aldolase [Devosia]MBS3848149.1 dihydroneopterin aldolase [Devosia litorisediminis]MCZ4345337.1 dihydroneopterin aldolase [Devosia neptuniae]|tara:strand:+ start:9653 stop:10039 length:387 start_codon:yes stop_codon:yes gene_type:complete
MAEPYTGDRIILKDLGFYGYHGVFAEEEKLGQRFFIDLELGTDLTAAAATDRLSAGISYADIYDVVKAAFETRRMKLLEAVAQNIVDDLFSEFEAVTWVIIRLRKPEAPIAMVRGEAAIELHRQRSAR